MSVDAVNGFEENKTMDLMDKYLSRVKPDNKRPKNKPYKIYSKILKDYLWIAATDKELKELVSEGVKEVIYIQAEVSMLIEEGVSKEGLEAIHKIKQVFLESRIEDVGTKS